MTMKLSQPCFVRTYLNLTHHYVTLKVYSKLTLTGVKVTLLHRCFARLVPSLDHRRPRLLYSGVSGPAIEQLSPRPNSATIPTHVARYRNRRPSSQSVTLLTRLALARRSNNSPGKAVRLSATGSFLVSPSNQSVHNSPSSVSTITVSTTSGLSFLVSRPVLFSRRQERQGSFAAQLL